jgi:hypothetical protein
MDLSIAMRFCMVQAQKEAAGNEVRTEHLFLGLLELDKPQQQKLPEGEIQSVKNILAKHGIHSGRAGDKLRELLRAGRQNDGDDISSLLAKVVDTCRKQGKPEVGAASMLELILQSPTALINEALSSHRNDLSPKREILSPAPDPKPVAAPRGGEPVFFDIPQPGETPQKGSPPQEPYRLPKNKRRTKINGITFRGGAVWAAIRYFFLGLAVPFGLLALGEYQWELLSAPSGKLMTSIPYVIIFLCLWFIGFGIVSLVRRKFRAFAGFLAFICNIVLIFIAFHFWTVAFHHETLPFAARIIISGSVLIALIIALTHVSQIKGSGDKQINSSMLRLKGSPGVIFFTYLLRALFVPIIAASVIWIPELSVNNIWKTIFYTYGFLSIYDAIFTALKCLRMRLTEFPTTVPFWAVRVVILLHMEYMLLFLPLLGWFLMWHFGWFPMKTWLVWVYSIYGFLVFWLTLGLLVSGEKNKLFK